MTHTHWDHIQGFPFFAPVFAEGCEWDLYALGGGVGERRESALSAQMHHPYSRSRSSGSRARSAFTISGRTCSRWLVRVSASI